MFLYNKFFSSWIFINTTVLYEQTLWEENYMRIIKYTKIPIIVKYDVCPLSISCLIQWDGIPMSFILDFRLEFLVRIPVGLESLIKTNNSLFNLIICWKRPRIYVGLQWYQINHLISKTLYFTVWTVRVVCIPKTNTT